MDLKHPQAAPSTIHYGWFKPYQSPCSAEMVGSAAPTRRMGPSPRYITLAGSLPLYSAPGQRRQSYAVTDSSDPLLRTPSGRVSYSLQITTIPETTTRSRRIVRKPHRSLLCVTISHLRIKTKCNAIRPLWGYSRKLFYLRLRMTLKHCTAPGPWANMHIHVWPCAISQQPPTGSCTLKYQMTTIKITVSSTPLQPINHIQTRHAGRCSTVPLVVITSHSTPIVTD